MDNEYTNIKFLEKEKNNFASREQMIFLTAIKPLHKERGIFFLVLRFKILKN